VLLGVATLGGHVEVVGLLLAQEGVDVNRSNTDDGTTPLNAAYRKGHTEVVEIRLACDGDNVNKAKTDNGATPLHAAALDDRRSIAQLLVAANVAATDTQHDETPQQWAATEDHLELVAWFGAVAGWLPLCVAVGCRLHGAVAIELKQDKWTQTHFHCQRSDRRSKLQPHHPLSCRGQTYRTWAQQQSS
jgi:hypothetical protein